MLCYVVAVVAVSDIEVTHRLLVINELAILLLIGTHIFRPHRTVTLASTPNVVRLQLDRCLVCVNQCVSVTQQRDVIKAVASVLFDTTLLPQAASRKPGQLPPKVISDSITVMKPVSYNLASTATAVCFEGRHY